MTLRQWLTCWSCPNSSSRFCYSPPLSYDGRGSQIRSEERATIKMSDGLFLLNSDEGRANWAQRQKTQSLGSADGRSALQDIQKILQWIHRLLYTRAHCWEGTLQREGSNHTTESMETQRLLAVASNTQYPGFSSFMWFFSLSRIFFFFAYVLFTEDFFKGYDKGKV